IEQREDGGRGADAERQRQHGSRRESRTAAKQPPSEANVLKKLVHHDALDARRGRIVDGTRLVVSRWSLVVVRGRWSLLTEGMLEDQVILDDPAVDQVFLDDSLENRRVALAIPGAFGIDDGDRPSLADSQTVRLRPQDAAAVRQAKLLQPLFQIVPCGETA